MTRARHHKGILNDSGFSLVELIVVVSILAIASVVLMKSFSMAAIVNSKAQRKQSATSLAESVMEEVKSTGIKQLQKKYNGGADTEILISDADADYDTLADKGLAKVPNPGPTDTDGKAAFVKGDDDSNPYYILAKKGVTSTKGEKFNVTATMRTAPYNKTSGSADASDANSIKLPVIEEIDTHTKTVLTQKELNKYDIAAQDYFKDHNIDPDDPHAALIESKEIIIDKEGDGSAIADLTQPDKGVIIVKCTVLYTASDSSKYAKEVFRGTYVAQKDKDGNLQKVDNSIYIFYNRFFTTSPDKESITINDSSANDDHKVFILFQKDLKGDADATNDVDMDNLNGTKIKITDGVDTKIGVISTNGALHYDEDGETVYGKAKEGDYWLITNLPENSGDGDGSILAKKKKNRLFEVTVRVNKADNSETLATITSTVNVME